MTLLPGEGLPITVASRYAEGYAEGRRSGIHCVVPIRDACLLRDCDTNLQGDPFTTYRAYWLGLKRGFRNHYCDAYRPSVLAARARHEEN